MTFQKSHLWAIAFVVALALSYFATKAQNEKTTDRGREAAIAGCVRSAARDAYSAAGFSVLASRVGARDNEGDARSAAQYRAVSWSVASALARPADVNDPLRLIAVDLIEAPNGELRYALTEAATQLQAEGCRQAFE